MTKREMLKEMCDCTTCKATKEVVENWYKEYNNILKHPELVVNINSWKHYATYYLGAKK